MLIGILKFSVNHTEQQDNVPKVTWIQSMLHYSASWIKFCCDTLQVDNNVNHLVQYLSCEQQDPFNVVLVDMKEAANEKIVCVEKPLDDEDLKFVAISYRWGELQETLVDTQLGYIAPITSFNLIDFCELCRMISHEHDLQHMDYVWVDAICVDQTNYKRRKATIHRMSDIYERANYILVVPDLNLDHLKTINNYSGRLICKSPVYRIYMYHLIHGNVHRLDEMEQIDDIHGTPSDMRETLCFFMDLITDWSSRVWVISEYHIAKKKNNLKYWFLQLELNMDLFPKLKSFVDTITFFKFDFTKLPSGNTTDIYDPDLAEPMNTCQKFHRVMIRQLGQQTFFEMMLNSKASKHEDRFYAIFPLTKYKNVILNKDKQTNWSFNTLLSVKLKMFEWMDTKDKLQLLFLSSFVYCMTSVRIFPTFATRSIHWPVLEYYPMILNTNDGGNFDLTSKCTMMLMPIDDNGYKLNLKPIGYYLLMDYNGDDVIKRDLQENKSLFSHLQLDESIDIVYISLFNEMTDRNIWNNDVHGRAVDFIFLIGNFEKNKWLMGPHPKRMPYNMPYNESAYTYYKCNNDDGFDIY